MNNDSAQRTFIEERVPFSKSKLWQLQFDYFEESGIDAWRQGEVPHYVTSNPFVGKTYAELVLAFLRDLARKGKTTEKVYLIELGAGHGRLCYYFLRHFERLLELCPVKLPPFCYVLSDITETNIEFWETHPCLQDYFERHILDCAHFDAVQSETIELRRAQRTIRPQSLRQPIVAIANYFFDTIPQELYYFNKGQVYQGLVSLSRENTGDEWVASEVLKDIQEHYEQNPLIRMPYRTRGFNRIMEGYRKELQNAWVLFPDIGLRCANRLRQLSKQGLLLLTADKGIHRAGRFNGQPPPSLVKHGSFSLTVNYHAFKKYCEGELGQALFPDTLHHSLDLGVLIFLNNPEDYKEIRFAYERFVQDFGPDDFFSIKRIINKYNEGLTLSQIMGVIRLSGYDSNVFMLLVPEIHKKIPELSEEERRAFSQMLHTIWDTYYPLGEKTDLSFHLGCLLYELNLFSEALVFFNLSREIYGDREITLYNSALCHCQLHEWHSAKEILGELLKQNRNNNQALDLLKEIEAMVTH